jgi:hypothetical protein
MPLRRRFNPQILQVGTSKSHKRRRKSKWRSFITLSGKSISPREAAKQAQAIQQDKETTATVFDVTEEDSDKTVRIDLGEVI